MTDSEILEVVEAHIKGKKIEVGYEINGEMSWTNYNGHPYDFSRYSYRVAPEPRKPREWTVPISYLESGQEILKSEILIPQQVPFPTVRVREVIE